MLQKLHYQILTTLSQSEELPSEFIFSNEGTKIKQGNLLPISPKEYLFKNLCNQQSIFLKQIINVFETFNSCTFLKLNHCYIFLEYYLKKSKKSHTCEEGGAHFRISFWHLLMNLKNKYLFKKLLKWVNKKQNNFNIYNVTFFLKNKEKQLEISLFYTCVPKISMI